ncbi:hypothetical protein COV82_06765 [Candidatus Peregrinibacteria bacterium CG11_big_fil_rev_8_21_14_0_20_46_8]|nr:MAG: hypothetical protein COV82_06765 [Candidatus Peregrinibacteria bacterium CG11_big_fil_rev_8_21_14_0_20_46_8]
MPQLPILGSIIFCIGTAFYVKHTVIDARTKPNRVTWLMWSVAPMIAAAAAFSDGVRWAALPVFIAGFAPLLVFFASFVNPKSYWKLERFDYVCGGLSVLSLLLWALTREPVVAVFFALLSDALASVPTIAKSWKYPETETGLMYIAGGINAGTSFFALQTFTFTELAFPAYLVALNVVLVAGIYGRGIVRIVRNNSRE